MASKHRLTDTAAQQTHSAVDRAANRAGQVEENLREKASEMDENLRETAQYAQGYADEAYSGMRSYVHDHPIASIAMAFGAGALVSAIMRKR